MSFYLQRDGEDGEQIATNTGWGDFGRWTEKLDKTKYGEMRNLYEQGYSDDPEALMEQLRGALEDKPPMDEDTKSVASALLTSLEDEPAETVVSVTDGMGEDDGHE